MGLLLLVFNLTVNFVLPLNREERVQHRLLFLDLLWEVPQSSRVGFVDKEDFDHLRILSIWDEEDVFVLEILNGQQDERCQYRVTFVYINTLTNQEHLLRLRPFHDYYVVFYQGWRDWSLSNGVSVHLSVLDIYNEVLKERFSHLGFLLRLFLLEVHTSLDLRRKGSF